MELIKNFLDKRSVSPQEHQYRLPIIFYYVFCLTAFFHLFWMLLKLLYLPSLLKLFNRNLLLNRATANNLDSPCLTIFFHSDTLLFLLDQNSIYCFTDYLRHLASWNFLLKLTVIMAMFWISSLCPLRPLNLGF